MTIRRTPQIRDYVSFPQHEAYLRKFLREVAEVEGLSISDTYALGAANFWAARHPGLWREASGGRKREELLREIGA